jgi:hypothetical protein
MHGLRAQCTRHGALLIFDEVMTGFRVGAQGAQGVYGIKPDLTTLGQGDRRRHAGGRLRRPPRRDAEARTRGARLPGRDAVRKPGGGDGGLATLKRVLAPGFFDKLSATTTGAGRRARAGSARAGVTFSAASLGGMFGLFFSAAPPRSFAEVMRGDREAFNRFFHGMLDAGVYLAPFGYEAGFRLERPWALPSSRPLPPPRASAFGCAYGGLSGRGRERRAPRPAQGFAIPRPSPSLAALRSSRALDSSDREVALCTATCFRGPST